MLNEYHILKILRGKEKKQSFTDFCINLKDNIGHSLYGKQESAIHSPPVRASTRWKVINVVDRMPLYTISPLKETGKRKVQRQCYSCYKWPKTKGHLLWIHRVVGSVHSPVLNNYTHIFKINIFVNIFVKFYFVLLRPFSKWKYSLIRVMLIIISYDYEHFWKIRFVKK